MSVADSIDATLSQTANGFDMFHTTSAAESSLPLTYGRLHVGRLTYGAAYAVTGGESTGPPKPPSTQYKGQLTFSSPAFTGVGTANIISDALGAGLTCQLAFTTVSVGPGYDLLGIQPTSAYTIAACATVPGILHTPGQGSGAGIAVASFSQNFNADKANIPTSYRPTHFIPQVTAAIPGGVKVNGPIGSVWNWVLVHPGDLTDPFAPPGP